MNFLLVLLQRRKEGEEKEVKRQVFRGVNSSSAALFLALFGRRRYASGEIGGQQYESPDWRLWVQGKRRGWLRIFGKRHQMRHLEFEMLQV
jgi:hypothetical protein